MIKFEEYEEVLVELQDKLNDENSTLTFLDVLTKLIRDLLGTHYSKYSWVKGLNFDEIAPQIALDYYLKVKSGLRINKWGIYLRKSLASDLVKFAHPKDVSYDDLLKTPYTKDEEDDKDYLIEIQELWKTLFPHLTKSEILILVELSTEYKLSPYDKVRGLAKYSYRKRIELAKILMKLTHYYRTKEVSMNRVTSNSLVRTLAGIMISPLFLVLDLEDMAKVIATLGGQTVRIPTYTELQKLIPLIILFYEHKINNKSLSELSKKFNLDRKDLSLILDILNQVKLSDYEKKNLIITLSKLTQLVNTQDSFISQRLQEIEDKLRKNSKTALELYKSLSKEEAKGLEDLIKLTTEIVKLL